jgi:hypothetical protein
MNEVPLEACVIALREDVCSICVCYSPDGNSPQSCIHESSGTCLVFRHLPSIIALAERFQDSSLLSLDNVFQMQVCTGCANADAEGVCNMRDRSKAIPEWCIADAYLPQVVGAIERAGEVEVG